MQTVQFTHKYLKNRERETDLVYYFITKYDQQEKAYYT